LGLEQLREPSLALGDLAEQPLVLACEGGDLDQQRLLFVAVLHTQILTV
jgi:hypothetical protein